MRQRVWLFIGLLIALALAVAVLLALRGASPTATAPDGRKVTIEKVTFGTHHRFVSGKWWVRVLKPIRGKRWAAQRGSYETRFTNDTPGLMVWTRWEGLTRSNGLAVEVTMLDQRGTESELIVYRWYDGPDAETGAYRMAWVFNNYPRRSDPLRVRFYDRDTRYALTQAVELTFSNPTRQTSKEWSGGSLPLVVAANRTQFALNRVEQTSNALWRLHFDVRTNGIIDPAWLVAGVTASSALGNVFGQSSNLAVATVTNPAFQLRGALWPEESAWRFAADFVRAGDFQPAELWTLTNISIPARNLPFQMTTNLPAHSRHPIELKLESIPPTVPYLRGAGPRNAALFVSFKAPDRHLFLFAASDELGSEIPVEVDPGAPRLIYAFGLRVPKTARSINLTFAIRKTTPVTFSASSQSLIRKP